MKHLLLMSCFILSLQGIAQITVIDNDFPSADDTVMVSSSDETSLDITTTGANSTWDFSTINISAQTIDTFHSVASAPALYQLVYNNSWGNPDYVSEYYTPLTNFDLSQGSGVGLEVESPVSFIRKTSTSIENVGLGMNINGIDVPASSDSVDVIYDLPMTYSDSWVSNSYTNLDLNPQFDGIFRRHQQRNSIVDGWGQITTPFKSYDVIRVKSLVSVQDSVYVGFLSSWLELPTPDQIEYSWFANGEKIPVMQIITQDIGGTETITSIEFKDKKRYFASVNNASSMNTSVFPNPATDNISITFDGEIQNIEIYSVSGKLVYNNNAIGVSNHQVNTSTWEKGVYIIKLTTESETSTTRFIVE
jgi:hypothetical protein